MTEAFELDRRLQADTWFVADWRLSTLLLMDHAAIPWFILVPRRAGLRELHDLGPDDAAMLVRESWVLARAMQAAFEPQTLNVAKLGNIVEQLHLHHVARQPGDPAWPGPVWGVPAERGLQKNEAEDRMQRVLGLVEELG
ncbi:MULTISPECIES: HIT domain-containing protein [unclassified Thioalkalivibrio]|uniref:HIT domain-containing protein n=1 Tax=unclassified Thioalkalivibrio TaxID=2621013 RepID=UPI0003611E25|nr:MULTISPECIES: HIT family protein [unclassified Thioalkalivibrio]